MLHALYNICAILGRGLPNQWVSGERMGSAPRERLWARMWFCNGGRGAKAAPKVEGEDGGLTAEVWSSECFGKGTGGCKEEPGSFCAVKPDPWCCLHGCVNQSSFTALPRTGSCLPHTSNGTCGKSPRDPTGVCVRVCVGVWGGGGTEGGWKDTAISPTRGVFVRAGYQQCLSQPRTALVQPQRSDSPIIVNIIIRRI